MAEREKNKTRILDVMIERERQKRGNRFQKCGGGREELTETEEEKDEMA